MDLTLSKFLAADRSIAGPPMSMFSTASENITSFIIVSRKIQIDNLINWIHIATVHYIFQGLIG